MVEGIQDLPVPKETEVQMRSRVTNPRAANLAESLASFDPLAGLHLVGR